MTRRRKLLLLFLTPPALLLLSWFLLHLYFLLGRASLEEALEREARAYVERDRLRVPVFGESVAGNAVEFYAAAEEKLYEILDAMDPEIYAAADAAREDFSTGDEPVPPPLAALADRLEPVFLLIETGARAEILKPHWDTGARYLVDDGDEPHRPADLAVMVREVAPASASLLAERGDPDACVDRLLALHRLGEDTLAGTGLQPHRGGFRHQLLALDTARSLVSAGRITGPPLARLGDWLLDDAVHGRSGWRLGEGSWLDEQAMLDHLAQRRFPEETGGLLLTQATAYVAALRWSRSRKDWSLSLERWSNGTVEDLRAAASWVEEKGRPFPFSLANTNLEFEFRWTAEDMEKLEQARAALLALERPDGTGPVFRNR